MKTLLPLVALLFPLFSFAQFGTLTQIHKGFNDFDVGWMADYDGDNHQDYVGFMDGDLHWYKSLQGDLDRFYLNQELDANLTDASLIWVKDFDGDSDLDILTLDGVDLVWLEFEEVAAEFLLPVSLGVLPANNPSSYQVVDMNADGTDELLVKLGDDFVIAEHSINMGNPVISLQQPSNIPTGITHFEFGDIDSDGLTDMAFYDGANLKWLPCISDNPYDFGAENSVATLTDLKDITIGAIDNNPRVDIAAAFGDNGLNKIVYFKNLDGLGTVWSNNKKLMDPYPEPETIQLADLDNDGDLDAIGTQRNKTASWAKNEGNSFTGPEWLTVTTLGIPTPPTVVAQIEDFNNDNFPDFVYRYTSSYLEDTTTVRPLINDLQNSGFMDMQPPILHNYENAYEMDVTDIDLDGDMDVVAAYIRFDGFPPFQEKVILYENLSEVGRFSVKHAVGLKHDSGNSDDPPYGTLARFIDWDEDGDEDIIAFIHWTPIWLENLDGMGDFAPPVNITSGGADGYDAIDIGDVNGDGLLDLLNETGVNLNLPNSPNVQGVSVGSGTQNRRAQLIDFDSDGDLDVVSLRQIIVGATFVFENKLGDATLWSPEVVQVPNLPMEDVRYSFDIIDYDQDGDDDIIYLNYNANTSSYEIYYNEHLDGFLFADRVMISNGIIPNSDLVFSDPTENFHIVDMNLDGWPDLVAGQHERNFQMLFLNVPNEVLLADPIQFDDTQTWATGVVKDMNNDGYPDPILVKNSGDGSIYWIENEFGTISSDCGAAGDLIFHDQITIDNFMVDFPNCTTVIGNLIIQDTVNGGDITNLAGLANIQSVTGNVEIFDNPILPDFTGLEQLTSIDGGLRLKGNALITDLQALSGLQTIGDFLIIKSNAVLATLNGLSPTGNLSGDLLIQANDVLADMSTLSSIGPDVGGNLEITTNALLPDLDGLDGIQTVGGDLIVENDLALTDVAALATLTTVGGTLNISKTAVVALTGLEQLNTVSADLTLAINDDLTSLSALSNLSAIGGALSIVKNISLNSLAGLDNIDYTTITSLVVKNNETNLQVCTAQSICDYLALSANPRQITNNGTGCNSESKVTSNCFCPNVSELIFTTQQELIDFEMQFLLCSDFEGNVRVEEATADAITDLCPLSHLQTISGDLTIKLNASANAGGCTLGLQSIGGTLDLTGNGGFADLSLFANLTSIGGDFEIIFNSGLLNTGGLTALQSVGGNIRIRQNGFMNTISGFGTLTNLGGDLILQSNTSLQTISGFNNLNTLGGRLGILSNGNLLTISGLQSLNTTNGLTYVGNNSSLTDLNGLGNLANIGGYLRIHNNTSLADLDDFSGLTSVNGALRISNLNALQHMNGLSNLQSINGSLNLIGNNVLSDISGLAGLDETTITVLKIRNNPALAFCSVQSICDFLDISVNYSFQNNASGCMDEVEVENNCPPLQSPPDQQQAQGNTIAQGFTFYPNPARDAIVVDLSTYLNQKVKLKISDYAGNEKWQLQFDVLEHSVQEIRFAEIGIEASGIYFIQCQTENDVIIKKMMIVR